MSLKKIAASTPWRRTGCSVISVTRSGSRQDSSIAMPSRTLRYSGSERPACRMNQTGVCGTSSRRAARTSGAVDGGPGRGWAAVELTDRSSHGRGVAPDVSGS